MKIWDWLKNLNKSNNLLKQPENIELEDTLQKYNIDLNDKKHFILGKNY